MSNELIGLYPKRSPLESVIDLVYLLVKESEPIGITRLKKDTMLECKKIKEFSEKCEQRGLVYHYQMDKRIKYQFTHHGKEFIYTWLDYIHTFDLIPLLNCRYVEPLPEKQNSRLNEIMKKKLSIPKYKKNIYNKRDSITMYRDLLSYLKSRYYLRPFNRKSYYYKPKYSYQLDIRKKIKIDRFNFKKLIQFALDEKRQHIQIKNNKKNTKRTLLVNSNDFEIFVKATRKNEIQHPPRKKGPDALMYITQLGIDCVDTFDKIMMEYGLTDLVYTCKPSI